MTTGTEPARAVTLPDYRGGSLLNLVAELEYRLIGSAVAPRLHPHLAAAVPDADTYVLVVFDGLGSHQLGHPSAGFLAADVVGTLDAPFPSTTTVALSTIATGRPPAQHGLLGYQLWMPEHDLVVNTIKWTSIWGDPVAHDTASMLPAPNLWERLGQAGADAVTVQPESFEGSPLSRMLYRGCRFDPVGSISELVTATAQLANPHGTGRRRIVVTYVPHVDFAAHVYGQGSPQYAEALSVADYVWSAVTQAVPPGVVVVGTADHGHVDFPPDRQIRIDKADHDGRIFYGDGRAMFVRGEGASLAERLPATWVPFDDAAGWWGDGPRHPSFAERRPNGILVADDGFLLLHRRSDDRMIGNHGGLTDAERQVPLLVSSR